MGCVVSETTKNVLGPSFSSADLRGKFFELIVGPSLFDSMATPPLFVRQILEIIDEFPDRWQEKWRTLDTALLNEVPPYSWQEWLEEMYFEGARREDFSREDLQK